MIYCGAHSAEQVPFIPSQAFKSHAARAAIAALRLRAVSLPRKVLTPGGFQAIDGKSPELMFIG